MLAVTLIAEFCRFIYGYCSITSDVVYRQNAFHFTQCNHLLYRTSSHCVQKKEEAVASNIYTYKLVTAEEICQPPYKLTNLEHYAPIVTPALQESQRPVQDACKESMPNKAVISEHTRLRKKNMKLYGTRRDEYKCTKQFRVVRVAA